MAPSSATPADSRAVSPTPSLTSSVYAGPGAASATAAAAAALVAEKLSFAAAPRPFKNPHYTRATGLGSKKNKNAKQVLALERERQLGPDFGKKRSQLGVKARKLRDELDALATEEASAIGTPAESAEPRALFVPPITYYSIEAPPSIRPQKKYCDVTGLEAPYRDPKSQLRYHNTEVFGLVRTFNPSAHQAYLSLRGSGGVML